MTSFKEWSGPVRRRFYRLLPWFGAGLALFGIMSESKAAFIVGFLGALLGPATGEVAARHVPDDDGDGAASAGG